jgi:hypothetical protein
MADPKQNLFDDEEEEYQPSQQQPAYDYNQQQN